MIFLYSLAFNIGWNPLQVTYVVEILPYHLRAKARTLALPNTLLLTMSQGLVLYNLFVAAALVFNQYANPIALANIGWKYYVVYDVWIFVELLVVYFLFPETGNMSLEQTAAVLDGIDVKDGLAEDVKMKVSAATVVDHIGGKAFEG